MFPNVIKKSVASARGSTDGQIRNNGAGYAVDWQGSEVWGERLESGRG
jgi:hypothetical protein